MRQLAGKQSLRTPHEWSYTAFYGLRHAKKSYRGTLSRHPNERKGHTLWQGDSIKSFKLISESVLPFTSARVLLRRVLLRLVLRVNEVAST